MLGMILYSINLFIAGVIVGRISVGFFSVKVTEKKKWGTDPDVPVPHFETALGDAIQQDLDGMHAKEQREAREIATGIVIDPGGTCLCRRCGHTLSAVFDNCQQCNNKLDWKGI